jgi:iron-sulfur cluster assembly protein
MTQKQALTISERAATRVKDIMASRDAGFLRVGVKKGGCAGMEYIMDYVAEPDPLDEIVKDRDVTIVVDATSLLFLLGCEIDWEVTPISSRFVFRNPNETDACGCGESVTLVPAQPS